MPGLFDAGGWFDRAGHDISNFFTHDVPAAARDIGHTLTGIVRDTSKLTGEVITNVTQPIVNTPIRITKEVLPEVTKTFNTIIPTASQGVKTVLDGTAGVANSLQMPLAIGLGVVGIGLLTMMRR